MSNRPDQNAKKNVGAKGSRGAASLLGKSGAAGLLGKGMSGGLPKPTGGLPKGAGSLAKPSSHANEQGPPAATKHPGKPETRRPTGRAVSGS
jgi:hypothetical protein